MNAFKFNQLLSEYKTNKRAVKEMYEYYYPLIVRNINRQFRGAVDGRDIAQQFFLKLFGIKANHIRAPNAWVFTVAKNIAIETLRKEGKQSFISDLNPSSDKFYLPIEIAEELQCLNETEGKIMYYRYWEKYRLKEIAEMLHMEYSSVRYYHRTAKRKMRKEIDHEKN